MERKENYSNELNNVLDYMENIIANDLPTTSLNLDYFILSILSEKKNSAYISLNSCLPTLTLDAMQESYSHYLSSKALAIIKPGREIRYDQSLIEALEKSEDERKKLNVDKITTEHVVLCILNDESNENRIKKVFNKAGLTYTMFYEKVASNKNRSNIESNIDLGNGYSKNVGSVIIPVQPGEDPKEVIERYMREGKIPGINGNVTNKKKNTKFPNIEAYCTNLNDMVEQGKIDPLVGRQNEINQITRILGRRKKNNVIIVGKEGTGKTTLCENLARKIIDKEVPEFLYNKKVIALDMTALIAGTTLRGMFEERVKGIMNEIKEDGNFILFIDNISNVMSTKSQNDYDISSMLSNAMENGEVQVIGTSDFKGFRSTFDKNPSLSRKFQKFVIEAPDIAESINVLNGLKSLYEKYHKVKFTDKAIETCVIMADKYISEKNLPDSAVDVMDEAGSLIGTSNNSSPEITDMKRNLDIIRKNIEILKNQKNFQEADNLEKENKELTVKLLQKTEEFQKERTNNPTLIDDDVILNIISNKTNIPINKLSADDKKQLVNIEERLKSNVIGQDEAINTICRALKRNRVGLSSNKCMFSGLMIGKSGIGKTLIAKQLAKEIFGDESALVRFDMSEYPDKSAVNKLIGSNPGYIGYEEGGQLTETIKNRKYCVLLLDEIEKADPEVYNIFLQVLDEGFLTDNSGMKVDFKNTIILFTSNVGTKAASDFGKGICFNEDESSNTKKILSKQLKNRFPPEFLNRLNSVIYFNNLNENNLKDIIKLELNKMEKRINNINYGITYDNSVIDFIYDKIKDEKEFGARPILRTIQNEIEDKITDVLLENDYESGHIFNIHYNNEISLN